MAMTQGAPVRRARHLMPRMAAVGVAGVLLAATAACGGSSKPSSSATTTSPPTATTSPTTSLTTSPTTSPTTGTPTGGAPADPAAAAAQVKQNWEAFFSPKTPVSDKEKYLQNGRVLAPLLQAFASDPRVGQVSATVTNVAFTSPTTATVTYSLSLSGTVVESAATGKAVLEDGTWKVADATLCGLVALTGNTQLPGCS